MSRGQGDPHADEQSTLLRPNAVPLRALGAWTLSVVEGVDAGKTFSFDGSHPSRVLIGTSPACDVRLTDSEVSRRHAEIRPQEGGWTLVDLNSTNGVRLNRRPLTVPARLHQGDVIEIGSVELVFEVG